MKTVLTIKAWKRPYYMKEVLASLERAKGIDDVLVIVLCDGGQTPENQDKRNEMRRMVQQSSIKMIFFEEVVGKNGCAGMTRKCFEKAFMYPVDYAIHMDDDVIVGKDVFEYFQYAHEQYGHDERVFAYGSFIRGAQRKGRPQDLGKVLTSTLFETGGAVAFHRKRWEEILSLGGLFGANGIGRVDEEGWEGPDDWKKKVDVNDHGSWGYPGNRFFCRGRSVCYPEASRSQNIGAKEGLWNPSEDWHQANILDPFFIDNLNPDGEPVTFRR